MINDLFDQKDSIIPLKYSGAFYLPNAALDIADEFIETTLSLLQTHPAIELTTPMGRMSSKLSNCGTWGWYSDKTGYFYCKTNPVNQLPWPELPDTFRKAAMRYAEKSGYSNFKPNACVINLYSPQCKMGLHKDADENDWQQPIVSLSFGLSAKFQLGGATRRAIKQTITLNHGDVIVWGGESRLNYHAIGFAIAETCEAYPEWRLNLTFRYVNSDS